MQYFKVKNFEKYQHYKDRRPPWIKLYRDIWQDTNFYKISDRSKLSYIGLLTIASELQNNIPFDPQWIKARLALSKVPNLKCLYENGFIENVEKGKDLLLATRYARDRDRDRDRYTEKNNSVPSDSKSESSEPHEPPIITLPLADKSLHNLTAVDLSELSKLYPGVDPEKELLKAKGWLIANPTRRKTRRGIARFLHGWLGRAQDRSNGKHEIPELPLEIQDEFEDPDEPLKGSPDLIAKERERRRAKYNNDPKLIGAARAKWRSEHGYE
jgi:hypothetical protein